MFLTDTSEDTLVQQQDNTERNTALSVHVESKEEEKRIKGKKYQIYYRNMTVLIHTNQANSYESLFFI